jgi:hypothetical protein
MSTLTANDILRYWALLTDEQKKEFLEEHASELSSDPELSLWISGERRPEVADSFFITFTEVYVSFGNLQRTVRKALAEGREREAVDRLFGQKFDSLRRLLERVFEETDTDRVRAYITVLCARQTVDAVLQDSPEFASRNRSDVNLVQGLIERREDIRRRFEFAPSQERDAFLEWFERWFVTRAQAIERQTT